jgi:hypothetical protein
VRSTIKLSATRQLAARPSNTDLPEVEPGKYWANFNHNLKPLAQNHPHSSFPYFLRHPIRVPMQRCQNQEEGENLQHIFMQPVICGHEIEILGMVRVQSPERIFLGVDSTSMDEGSSDR